MLELLYRWRTWIARTLTGTLLGLMAIAAIVWVRPSDPPSPPAPDMQISLLAAAPAPPAPVEPPPPPVVTKDQFIDKQVKHRERTPQPAPPSNLPPTPDAPPSPLPPGPPATPPARPSHDLEDAYRAAVRQHLESIKRYPTEKEARIQQPQGTVVISFRVSRDGTLLDVKVEQSAGSILDRAAIATVKRGRYAPFPNEAWPGDSATTITVHLEFKVS